MRDLSYNVIGPLDATTKAICWDRGRPARNEREARKRDWQSKTCACGVAGGTPAVPANHSSEPTNLVERK
jgi:hypothetical protein